MAESPTHRFGQIIGDLLEAMLRPPLQAVTDKYGLYLDYRHLRPTRNGPKVTWTDFKGNRHDLDYVFEAGGSDTAVGRPRAFIETAWRRYTKHSRNKAQEIQGAVIPLAETYSEDHPFLGVVLAGIFTRGSLEQLRSHGFEILYYPYDSVVKAFAAAGIDARFDEKTSDDEVQAKVDAYDALSTAGKAKIAETLIGLHSAELAAFLKSLEVVLTRTIEAVYVIALHGRRQEMATAAEALAFLAEYAEEPVAFDFLRYEVTVRYTNRNEIRGTFGDKGSAMDFLRRSV